LVDYSIFDSVIDCYRLGLVVDGWV